MKRRAFLLAPGLLCLAAGLLPAAPVPAKTSEIIKDRSGFIPHRKYFPTPGKTIGLLVSDVRAMMGQEGRSGPADAFGFSQRGGSYRWVYVPVTQNAMITRLQVHVGEQGNQIKIYPLLSMASPTTVKKWNITDPYSLVEVEVNDQLGAPAEEGFVATSMKQLDGGKEYPFRVTEVVEQLRKKYQEHVQSEQRAIAKALADAQREAMGDRKATGPRTTQELMYLSWMPESRTLRAHFRTIITDGAFQRGQGIERDPPVPLPLPVPPIRRQAQRAQQIAPPRFEGARFGTSFGIEFGMAYEVTVRGDIASVQTLPFKSFKQELPPPPLGRPQVDPPLGRPQIDAPALPPPPARKPR